MTDLIREHDEYYPGLMILTEPHLFVVDGIVYDPETAPDRLFCRPMIQLFEDGRQCGVRQWWNNPPTEAELDSWVAGGVLPSDQDTYADLWRVG